LYVKTYIFLRRSVRHAGSMTKTSLPTAEARRQLPSLVKEMGAKVKASASLLQDAVDIGPHRTGGAILIPAVDVVKHQQTVEALRARVEQLEGELEDVALGIFLQQRLATTTGDRLGAEEFLTGIGMEEFVAKLPGA
jgi:hypothetical protein